MQVDLYNGRKMVVVAVVDYCLKLLLSSCLMSISCICLMTDCRRQSRHEGCSLCSTRQGYHTSLC